MMKKIALIIIFLAFAASIAYSTVVNWGGNEFTGLSTDTKPTNVVTGSRFFTTDTNQIYIFSSGSWTQIITSGGGGVSASQVSSQISSSLLAAGYQTAAQFATSLTTSLASNPSISTNSTATINGIYSANVSSLAAGGVVVSPAASTGTTTWAGGNVASSGTYTANAVVSLTTASAPNFSIAGVLAATQTGSNWTFPSQAIGDIAYANSTTSYTRLADVALGSVLASGGVGVAPGWVTALPNGVTATTQGYADNSTKIATDAWVELYAQPLYATTSALVAGATVTWTPTLGTNIYTLTPGQTETINMGTVPSGCVGSYVILDILTSGTTSYVLTFGTNLKSQGTLTTGGTTGKHFIMHFLIETTSLVEEISRTIAM
jgi:hypothetical protein